MKYRAIYKHDTCEFTQTYEFADSDIDAAGITPEEWATTWCPKGFYLDEVAEVVDGPADIVYRWLATAFGWTITLAMGAAFGAMFIWMFFIATN